MNYLKKIIYSSILAYGLLSKVFGQEENENANGFELAAENRQASAVALEARAEQLLEWSEDIFRKNHTNKQEKLEDIELAGDYQKRAADLELQARASYLTAYTNYAGAIKIYDLKGELQQNKKNVIEKKQRDCNIMANEALIKSTEYYKDSAETYKKIEKYEKEAKSLNLTAERQEEEGKKEEALLIKSKRRSKE
jgi:hypothetical protein